MGFNSRGKVLTAEFSPDERRILVASAVNSDDGDIVEMFDVQTGTRLHAFSAGHGATSCGKGVDAAFSPKGDLVMVFRGRCDANCSCQAPGNNSTTDGTQTACGGGVVSVYGSEDGQLKAVLLVESKVSAIWSPDGRSVLAASPRGSATLLDASSGTRCASVAGHVDGFLFECVKVTRLKLASTAFSRDGSKALLACRDGTARLMSVAPLESPTEAGSAADSYTLALQRVFRGHSAAVLAVESSSDGSLVLTASADGSAKLFDVTDGSCLQTFFGDGGHGREEAPLVSAHFSLDAEKVLTINDGHTGGTCRLFNSKSGSCEWTYGGDNKTVLVATFSRPSVASCSAAGYSDSSRLCMDT